MIIVNIMMWFSMRVLVSFLVVILLSPTGVASFFSVPSSSFSTVQVLQVPNSQFTNRVISRSRLIGPSKDTGTTFITMKNRKSSLNSKMTSTLLQSKSKSQNSIESQQNNDEEMGILAILTFVVPLLLVYISNQWSRSSLYYLVDFSSSTAAAETTTADAVSAAAAETATHAASFYAMNLDIGFDQAQYGALASIAFTTLFAITSLFAGSLADKYNRKYLTIGSTFVWSLATYTTSIASTYDEIVISRIVMGLACAFTTPCAYTLLKDTISNSKLSFANSLYGSGVYFGGGLSSLSILLDENYGWRSTCGIIGGYGVAMAVLSTLILPNDPKQQLQQLQPQEEAKSTVVAKKDKNVQTQGDDASSNTLLADVQEIVSSSKRIQWLFLGSFLRFCSGLCIGVWAAPYYKLAFPSDASSYAVINAAIVGFCGVSSGLLGGYISDKSTGLVSSSVGKNESTSGVPSTFSTLDENGARLIVPVVGSLLAVPAWWLTCHASTFDAAMIWLGVEYLVAECWFGPTVAVLQNEVKKGQGGVAQGLFTLTGAVGNLAPSILGVLFSRQIAGDLTAASGSGSEVLSTLLGVGVCSGYLLSAGCFSLSALASSSPKIEGKTA